MKRVLCEAEVSQKYTGKQRTDQTRLIEDDMIHWSRTTNRIAAASVHRPCLSSVGTPFDGLMLGSVRTANPIL